MNTIGRMHHNTPKELIEEFLNRGGKVKVCSTGERTEEIEYTSGFYGRKKKKVVVEDVEVEVEVEVSDDES